MARTRILANSQYLPITDYGGEITSGGFTSKRTVHPRFHKSVLRGQLPFPVIKCDSGPVCFDSDVMIDSGHLIWP